MSVVTPGECRDRGIQLPLDDGVAQDIIDEQEAWLARRIGLLVGARTETFRVGLGGSSAKLGLARPTDSVAVVDGGVTVATSRYRLVDQGSAIALANLEAMPWWQGPYIVATYTASDELEVRKAIFDLIALAGTPVEKHTSEQIGAYSYSGGGAKGLAGARGVIVSSLLPTRDPLATLAAISRRVSAEDPVINRAEPWT